jgi:solute carrier family 39 (zinc transporter), member 1/2/3
VAWTASGQVCITFHLLAAQSASPGRSPLPPRAWPLRQRFACHLFAESTDMVSYAALTELPSALLLAELRRRDADGSSKHNDNTNQTPECGSGSTQFSYNTPLHVFALALILFLSTAACSFPIVVKRFPGLPVPHHFLFLSRHFGTGVLIATAFVHLLPTAFVSLTDPCLPSFWNQGYPAMAGFIAMVSVLVVVAIEMFFASRGAGHVHGSEYDTYGTHERPERYLQVDDDDDYGDESARRPSMGQARRSTTRARLLQTNLGDELLPSPKRETRMPHRHHRPPRINIDDVDDPETVGLVDGVSPALTSAGTTPQKPTHPSSHDGDHDSDLELELDELAHPSHARTDSSSSSHLLSPSRAYTPNSGSDVAAPAGLSAQDNQRLFLQCLLLEAGILFHSVFIGMALSVSTGPPFIILLLAISFHQTFEGFALGARISALVFPPRSPKPWLMALAYGTTTPIGQAIGLAIHNLYDPASQTGLLMVGFMNAVSSGLLLFAGLVELLAEDFLSEDSYKHLTGRRRLQACGAVVAGAGGMALIGAWA